MIRNEVACERCGREALRESVTILNAKHRYCQLCYADAVNAFVRDHRDEAESIGRGKGEDWALLSDHEVAATVIAELDHIRNRMRTDSAHDDTGQY